MGCVVNGPGEMGMRTTVTWVPEMEGESVSGERDGAWAVPEEEAIEALKQLIKENGDWND